jgi:hypothetical protein
MTIRTTGIRLAAVTAAALGATMLASPLMAQTNGGAQVVGQVSAAVCTNPAPSHASLKGMIVGFS